MLFRSHGTADTLVPYTQALSLCGAIDDRVLPTGVVDPLTSYDCGVESEIQLVRDAEHAFELGVCIDSVCPAGQVASETRTAVATAIEASYAWLVRDPAVSQPEPPEPEPVKRDKDGLGAIDGRLLLALLLVLIARKRALRRQTGGLITRPGRQ